MARDIEEDDDNKTVITMHPDAVDTMFEYESLHASQKNIERVGDELQSLNDDLLEAFDKNTQGKDLSVALYVWVQDTLKEQQHLLQSIFNELDMIEEANKKLLQASGISKKSFSESKDKMSDFLAARLQVYDECCQRAAEIVKKTYQVQTCWRNRLHGVSRWMDEATTDRKKLLQVCLDIERAALELQGLWQELAIKTKDNGIFIQRLEGHVSGMVEKTVISKKAMKEAVHLQKDIKKKKVYIAVLGVLLILAVAAAGIAFTAVKKNPDLVPPWLRKFKK